MAVAAGGVSGRTISREISSLDDEVSEQPRSREITLPDEIRRRCQPVPHDALWLRLNVAPRLPSDNDIVVDSGPQVRHHNSETISHLAEDQRTFSPSARGSEEAPYNAVASTDDRLPEVGIDFRSHSDSVSNHRHRRDTRRNSGRQQQLQQQRQRRRQQRRKGRRRHSEKQQRSRRRHLLSKLSSDGSAWRCHMTSRWLRMPPDVFPPYIQTGSCAGQSRCMMGLYECRERRYATRVLRRLPGRCNPLPVAGDGAGAAGETGYEEVWVADEYHVTVGCECSKRRTSGWYDELQTSLHQ